MKKYSTEKQSNSIQVSEETRIYRAQHDQSQRYFLLARTKTFHTRLAACWRIC